MLGGRWEILYDWHALIIEAALTTTEDCTLNSTLIALTIFLETFCLFTLAAFFNSLWLYSQAKSLRFWQIFPVIINKTVYISGQCVNDGLLVFFLIGGMVATGMAIACL